MEISIAVITFIILFCLYLAIVSSKGLANAHTGPIRMGDAGYDPDNPNHQ